MTKTLLARITDTARAALFDLATIIPSGFQTGKPLEQQPRAATYATTHFGPPPKRIDSDANLSTVLKQPAETNGYVLLPSKDIALPEVKDSELAYRRYSADVRALDEDYDQFSLTTETYVARREELRRQYVENNALPPNIQRNSGSLGAGNHPPSA